MAAEAATATERGEIMATRNLDEALAFVPLGFLPGDGAADDGAEEGSGGAEFHDVEGLAAAAKGKPEKGGGGGCPAGECKSFEKECAAELRCFEDPCATARCASGTACESNYCGGCEARCVRARGGGAAVVTEATAEGADGDGGEDAEQGGSSPHAKASDERDYAPPPPPPRVESPHLELKTFVDRMKLMKQISVSGGGVGDLDAADLHSKFSSEKDGVNPDRLPEAWQPPASIEMAPRAPEPEEDPDDRSSCRSVDGIYGGVSPRGGVVVRYQYEMVAKETAGDDAGDVVDVAGDVLPRIEGGVTDGLLPVFFEDECKGSAAAGAAAASPGGDEGVATVAGAERRLRGSRRERGQRRRRLNRIIGIDASPDDFVLPQRECTLDESPLAAGAKCHVVEGALTLHFPPNYSINTLIQGAQLSTLNAIRDGMFDGSLLEDVGHPAILKLTLLEGSYSLAPILPKDPSKDEVVAIQEEPKKGGSAGLIAGVVVTLLVLCCCGGGLFVVRRRRNASKVVESDEEQGKKKKKKKRVEDESDRSGLDFIGDQLEGAGVVKGKKGKKKKKKKNDGAGESDRSGLDFVGDQLAMDGVVEEKGGKKKNKKKVAAMVRKLSRKTLKTDEEDDEYESKGSALDFIGDQLDQSITSKEKKKKKNGEGADESDRSDLDNIGDQLETDGVVSEKGEKKKKGKKVNFKKLSRKTKKEDEDGDGVESVRSDLDNVDGEEGSSEQGKKKKMKIKKVAPGGLAKGLSFRNMGKQGGTGEGGGARGLSFRNLGKKKNKDDEEQDQLDEESQHDEDGSVSGSEASRSFRSSRSSQASSYLSRSILSGDDGRSARSSVDDAGSARRPSDFTSRSEASQSYDDGSVGSRSYDGSDRDSAAGGSSRRSSYSSASEQYDRDRRDWGSGSEGSDREE
ncbi:hypothetical protein ACHAWF_005448 [Thalassiosira exigua]